MPRRASMKGTSVNELTADVYHRAYRLFVANKTDREIKRIIGLTREQLDCLYHIGLPPKRGRDSADFKPFIERLAEEDAALTAASREIGAEVSRRGVNVLTNAMINVGAAGLIVNRFLKDIEQGLKEAGEGRLTAANLPNERVLEALQVLRPFADPSPIANAWQRMYQRASPNTPPPAPVGRMFNMPPGSEHNLPASIAVFRTMAGDEAKNQVIAAIAGEMSDWTPEQITAYALTGHEPTHNGTVIDAQEVEREEDGGEVQDRG